MIGGRQLRLFLMRHGDSAGGLYDDIRPLSEVGIRESQAAGEFLKLSKDIPDIIYHSPLLRSRHTASLAAEKIGFDGVICENEGLLPDSRASTFDDELPTNIKGNLLVVGHLPHLSNLTSYLLTGSEGTLGIRFTAGSLICLERSNTLMEWSLRYYVTTKLIRDMLGRPTS